MTVLKSCFRNYAASSTLLLFSGIANALDTQVTLQADTLVTPTSAETVTFGLPLAEGEVANISEIKVSQGSQELPAFVEAGLRYHWSDNSIRSVTIQLQNVDMTSGNIEVQITDDGASLERLSEQDHSTGWTTAGSDKNNLPYPRIFALHDKDYLKGSGLIPPYLASTGSSDSFEQYQLGQFDTWAGALNYASSSGGNWLFDRSSAMFKAYMSTGNVKFLKEAFLAKQFYFTYIRNDGSPVSAAGGDGCFTFGGVSCSDGKYIAPQQAKLAWALVGDDSQWDLDLIKNMALQADLGWSQYASRDPYDNENEGFTERGAGIAGLAEINAYEMTGDSTVLAHLNERIASLKDMQQTEKAWDVANGWTPKSGGFTHNIDVHEGVHNEGSAPSGDTNARGFSAWMIENIIDFLWQTYWITGNADAPEMLRLAANAVETYGFTSTYDDASDSYIRKPGYTSYNRTKSCNTTGEATDLLYMASAYADQATRISDDWWPYYSDTHNVETVLTLGVGYYFETDEEKKARLQSRINKIIEGWINTNCTQVFSGVYRLFNWQHRSNSIRTWQWIAEQSGVEVVTPAVSLPLSPGAFSASIVVAGGTGDSGSGSDGSDSGSGSGGSDSGSGDSGTGSGGSGSGSGDSGSGSGDSGSGSGDSGTGSGGSDSGSDGSDSGSSDTIVPIFVASSSCSVGDDPHWQCSGQWVNYSDVEPTQYVAVCLGAEGSVYSDCSDNDRYVLMSSVDADDGLFVCASNVSMNAGRTSCDNVKYARTANLGDLDSIVTETDTGGAGGSGGTGDTGDTGGTGGTGGSGGSSGSGTTSLAFTDVTLQIMPDLVSGQSPVVAPFEADVAHLNDDMCLDIFITSHATDAPDGIYLQDNANGACQGTYTYMPNSYSANGPTSRRITSWLMLLDLDGDTDTDILGGDVDGNPSLASTQNADGSFTGVSGCLYDVDRCLPIDFNGDGDIELIAAPLVGVGYNSSLLNVNVGSGIFGSIYSWPERDTLFTPQWSGITVPNLTRAWATFMVFDANNDSYPDLVHPQLNMIFFNGPSGFDSTPQVGNFTASASMFDTSYSDDSSQHSNPHQQVPIDYDNDGDFDIFKIRVNKGGNNQIDLADADGDGDGIWLLQNNGSGVFTDVSTTELAGLSLASLTYQTTYAGLGVGDFNNDGKSDLRADWLTGGGFSAPCGVILNGGTGSWTKHAIACENVLSTAGGRVPGSGGASKTVVAHGDYDGDGLLDLISSNAQRSSSKDTVAVWRNTGDYDNNWLSFVVRGAPTYEGLHTRITIKAKDSSDILCTREIYVAQQYGATNEHCGLAEHDLVDIDMQLPNGGDLVEFRDVSANQHLTLYATGQLRAFNRAQSKPAASL